MSPEIPDAPSRYNNLLTGMISCCSCSKVIPVPWSPHSSCLQRDLFFYFMNGHCLFRRRADLLAGAASDTALDLTKGACQFNCNRCSQVCPTGAIRPLTLAAKQKTKIAEARFNPRTCIVFQDGAKCGKCADACPVKAVTLRRTGAPRS